jgi:hypothetical protein
MVFAAVTDLCVLCSLAVAASDIEGEDKKFLVA